MTANTTSTVSNFEKTYQEFIRLETEMRTSCLDMLKEICNRREDKTIDLSNFKDFRMFVGDCYPTIAYDGGRHPEYATNMFSGVDGFRLEDNKILFDIEDTSNYDDYRVSTDDLINLCEMIIEYEQEGYVLGVKDYVEDEE